MQGSNEELALLLCLENTSYIKNYINNHYPLAWAGFNILRC